jgi:hypothetical protein
VVAADGLWGAWVLVSLPSFEVLRGLHILILIVDDDATARLAVF